MFMLDQQDGHPIPLPIVIAMVSAQDLKKLLGFFLNPLIISLQLVIRVFNGLVGF